MLQRIQTIWLFLAALCAFLSFKFSFYSGAATVENVPNVFMQLTGATNIQLIIATTAVGVLALVTVFLYGNRKLQLRLCIAGMALEALLIFLYYTQVKNFTTGTYSLTALLQGCIVLFFFLAARGISADEKLIRESNRLR